ncbi:VanZ like family protein [Rosistilla carotiformis]|uniref:VanZ like family protein n=1 Tax=Rosistilla carotiformis TaxID=2528017 RepID=A0A518JMS8_9BACT|nr:VanZ family protein [Rosistilla carotiformis]QDV66853.1 VanZ like family protein [Rosistilla carotiformis]
MRQIITTTVLGMRLASLTLVAYWSVIFTGTHIPSVRLPSFSNADKAYHFAAFTGLAILLAWALPKSRRHPRRHLLIALGIGVAYAIFDESTQLLVRGRSAEVLDFAADCGGLLTGLFVYSVLRSLIAPPLPKLHQPSCGGRVGM